MTPPFWANQGKSIFHARYAPLVTDVTAAQHALSVNFRPFLVLEARFGFWMFGLARFEAGKSHRYGSDLTPKCARPSRHVVGNPSWAGSERNGAKGPVHELVVEPGNGSEKFPEFIIRNTHLRHTDRVSSPSPPKAAVVNAIWASQTANGFTQCNYFTSGDGKWLGISRNRNLRHCQAWTVINQQQTPSLWGL